MTIDFLPDFSYGDINYYLLCDEFDGEQFIDIFECKFAILYSIYLFKSTFKWYF